MGDRVAGFLPNIPEAVIAMLATASLGAIWSSCSPDFGVSGVLDRFGQIRPRVLFRADGYRYAGKEIDLLARECARSLVGFRRSSGSSWCDISARPAWTRRMAWKTFAGSGMRRWLEAARGPALAAPRSSGCPSTTRSTSCTRRAPPGCRSAWCTAPAARCCSTSRSWCCTPTSPGTTGSSTSPPAAG